MGAAGALALGDGAEAWSEAKLNPSCKEARASSGHLAQLMMSSKRTIRYYVF